VRTKSDIHVIVTIDYCDRGVYFDRTLCRLLQKRVMRTKSDIYVIVTIDYCDRGVDFERT
jgi:hypothetical protein